MGLASGTMHCRKCGLLRRVTSLDKDSICPGCGHNSAPVQWLIFSHEHEVWWAPDEQGYTTDRDQAGRYDFDRALEICKESNVIPGSVEETMVADDFIVLPKR
jgi:hypothetical protein